MINEQVDAKFPSQGMANIICNWLRWRGATVTMDYRSLGRQPWWQGEDDAPPLKLGAWPKPEDSER